MSLDPEQAIAQARRLLEDAALFHLASIPLPVKVVAQLIEAAEQGIAVGRTPSEG
jgi:hypothetical protein